MCFFEVSLASGVHRIFESGGGGGRKFVNNAHQKKKFSIQNQFVFCPKLGEDRKRKKRSSLRFSLVFGRKVGEDQKNKQKKALQSDVRFCTQTFCPSYKGGVMPQFYIIFYANFTILATQRRGPRHVVPS